MRLRHTLPLLLLWACDTQPGLVDGGARDGADLDSAALDDLGVPEDVAVDTALDAAGDTGGDVPVDVAVAVDATDGATDGAVADVAPDAAPEPTLCEVCEGDDDCPSGLCLEVGLRRFCGADCADDEDCADGFECIDTDLENDEEPLQCVPAGGLCPACAGDDTTCDGIDDDCDGTADEDFVGVECADSCASVGCVAGEVTACPDPSVDGCDGVDDDCDGTTDEDYVAGPGCGVGACARGEACVSGEAACEPGEAAADDATCDAVDDDCDGAQDEDFVSPERCGLGVCERAVACVGGEVGCVPGEPLAATDVTCDGIDDDCDGAPDDECQRNVLRFELAEMGEGFVDVNLVYAQQHSPLNDGVYWQPRALDLRVLAPVGLSLRLPNPEGVVPGPSVVAADKRINVVRRGERETRLSIISAGNSNRVAPGVLATLRYTHDAAPPFGFEWDELRTNMAPVEALEVLEVEAGLIQ